MEVCKKNLVSYLNSSIFRGNAQLQANCSRGFHPRFCGFPDAITPGTGATSSSLSAGTAWEDRHCPILHSYQHPEFHIHGKGILQSRKIFFFKTGLILVPASGVQSCISRILIFNIYHPGPEF
jgi:hypothetical protein